jgi:hypothetical protein
MQINASKFTVKGFETKEKNNKHKNAKKKVFGAV